jgi:peptidyl-prolyl cis-trans isomerase B (cyclophilin B)
MNFNKVWTVILAVVLIVLGINFFKDNKEEIMNNTDELLNNNGQGAQTENSNTEAETVPDSVMATVETSMGSFELTLDGKAAPKTVANFVKLANDGFYEGLTFHRVVKSPGFHLIQGGDPAGNGTGGPGYTVPAEIGLKHTKGAIATARTGDQVNPERASSGSQFYIVTEDIAFLDGQYTVFGYVTSGLDVVEKINQVPTDANDMPTSKVTINKITIK